MLVQNNRIGKLEGGSSQASESEGSRPRDKIASSDRRKSKSKGKKEWVDEEKERQLRVVQEKLDRSKHRNKSETEEESEEEVDMKGVRKKMSRKQRDETSHRVSGHLKHAGALFPLDDLEANSSSGMESGESLFRGKSQVKSGAKVKKRPVIQTELWPHTIANEDDGDDVDSESIGLAKFFSCFTYIMVNCSRAESAGRSVLLHAVSLVLEYLPWTEARAFHNMVMVKLEQGRISWSSDFSALAEQYIDKKVRLTLRARASTSGAASHSKTGYASRNYGKGYGSSNNRYDQSSSRNNANKSLYTFVCKQWNGGSCSYGERCRKWHVCWTCAEAGKLGEAHRASSHYSSGARGKQPQGQGDQRG